MTEGDARRRERIMNAVDHGNLTKEETVRRLEALFEQEIAKAPSEMDTILIDMCQNLLWDIQTDGAPMPSFDVEKSYRAMRKRIRREERREIVGRILRVCLPKLIPFAAVLMLVVGLSTNGLHYIWFTEESSPDEQQHTIRGHEITVEMVQSALADNNMKDSIVISDFAEFETYLGFDPEIPTALGDEWLADYGIIRYFSGYIGIVTTYTNLATPDKSITCAINYFTDAKYAYFSFEQTAEGEKAESNGIEMYLSNNIERNSATWYNQHMYAKVSGNITPNQAANLLLELIGENDD